MELWDTEFFLSISVSCYLPYLYCRLNGKQLTMLPGILPVNSVNGFKLPNVSY